MYKSLRILFLFILISFRGFCQCPGFQIRYDTLGMSFGNCLRQTSDGGYIITGMNYQSGTAQNLFVQKTDSCGTLEWVRTYGGTSTDAGIAIEILNDTNYFVSGIKDNVSASQSDLWNLKLGSNGNVITSNINSFGPGVNLVTSSCKTYDGGVIVTGNTNAIGNGRDNVFLMKFDSNGDTMWTKIYGGPYFEDSYNVIQTSDSGYIFTGYTDSIPTGLLGVLTIKTDKNGNTLWSRTYTTNFVSIGKAVAETADGGFVITGYNQDTVSNYDNVLLIKYDIVGTLVWDKIFILSQNDDAIGLVVRQNGNIFIGGSTYDSIVHHTKAFILEINSIGDSLSFEVMHYSPTSDDGIYSMISNSNGGFTMSGFSNGPLINSYLLKTDSNGIIDNVSAINEANQLKIYPNPTSSYLRINDGNGSEDKFYYISNSLGSKIKTGIFRKEVNTNEVDITDLASGIYYLAIQNSDIIQTLKFIVIH